MNLLRMSLQLERAQLKVFSIFFNSAEMCFKTFLYPVGVLSGLRRASSDALWRRCARSNCSDIRNRFINKRYECRQ